MNQNNSVATAGKKYEKPALTRYGKIVELTAGGSMGNNEWRFNMMNMCWVQMSTSTMRIDNDPGSNYC